MDKQHTKIIKGIAIMGIILSHMGNANGIRILALENTDIHYS